ncbi:serine hydrolase domain-containing protein [Maribacter halichondriae]|uniref:serine hydrolase domain-containing protein n=1 Tax=Maribacter halichondriae TaxID=2980554 RepID=UPI002359C2DF|nr:serine hydrolase domain-containing protein [Maribacter sp. Hal144]
MKMVVLKISCFIFLFIHGIVSSQSSYALEKDLTSLADEYLKINPEASGVMAAVDYPNTLNWKHSVGHIGREKENKLQGDELFIAASITKTFVAVCMLQMEEEGLLSLEDKATKYLDEQMIKELTAFEGKTYEKELTLEHLLRHTSGIADYLNKGQIHLNALKNEPERKYSLRDRIDIALNVTPSVNKLGKYNYSNTNYILLGMIAEKIEKKNIANIIGNRIVTPLALKNTSLQPSAQVLPMMFKGYYTDWDLTEFTLNFNHMNSSGGILTNIDDLLLFGQAAFSGKLFKSKTTLDKMLDFEKGYGLGVMLYDTSRKTGKVMGHSGFDPGYTCYLAYLENQNATIVTVINQSELKVVMPAFLIVKAVAQIKKSL